MRHESLPGVSIDSTHLDTTLVSSSIDSTQLGVLGIPVQPRVERVPMLSWSACGRLREYHVSWIGDGEFKRSCIEDDEEHIGSITNLAAGDS